jgi:hypothetical protein
MNLELMREGEVYKVIGSALENTNSFSWKIPGGVKAGKDYTIRLTDITDPMQPSVSGNFEIKPKLPMLVKIAVPVVIIGGVIAATQLGGGGGDDNLPAITVKPN